MAIRKTKSVKKKSWAVKPKKTVKKSPRKKVSASSQTTNKKAHWAAYRELQKKVDLAWDKLKQDVKKKVSTNILTKHKNHLMLLLGECNYMARECKKNCRKPKK